MSERTIETITCCQFCGETGFDAEGVKWHLVHGHCEAFNSLPLRPCFASDDQPQEDLAALIENAERYRKIRAGFSQGERGIRAVLVYPNGDQGGFYVGGALDAAVDAMK